jgi:hypothetical protein
MFVPKLNPILSVYFRFILKYLNRIEENEIVSMLDIRKGVYTVFSCIDCAIGSQSKMMVTRLSHNGLVTLQLLQVVELDFLYPSEGIHRRWDNGYRITAMAGTMDQSALILSRPRRRPRDETQETLRTTQFPSQHVKVEHKISGISLCLLVAIFMFS